MGILSISRISPAKQQALLAQSNNSPYNPRMSENQVVTKELTLTPDDNDRLAMLSGQFDENLIFIEKQLGVKISHRGNYFEIIGAPPTAEQTAQILLELYNDSRHMKAITHQDIALIIKSTGVGIDHPTEKQREKFQFSPIKVRNHIVKPRTINQRGYLESIQKYDLNFGIGPAGTGKTFLAAACAMHALEKELVKRIVLVRPAVEAGESLGFLPGDLTQKIDPYLRPLYDALYEILGINTVNHLIGKGIIEIVPLAYMRGRTLNDAFIILDEGQNTTKEQMKMFLTRIGFGSKAVITGDITQVDLPKHHGSGLCHAITLLKHIKKIEFTFFTSKDVVRHPLVQSIIEAYEKEQ